MDISNPQAGELVNVYDRYANIVNHVWDDTEGRWVLYETE
jgi:hypothetical protein